MQKITLLKRNGLSCPWQGEAEGEEEGGVLGENVIAGLGCAFSLFHRDGRRPRPRETERAGRWG